ncbi:MAG: transglycosylase domain-containing protein [Dehalococcoidia bacterium]
MNTNSKGRQHRHVRLHRINHRRKGSTNLPIIIGGFFALVLTGAVATGVGLFMQQYADASDEANVLLDRLQEQNLPGNVFYARNGALLHQDVRRTENGEEILLQPVPLDSISPYLIDAVIATEDSNFYDNPGINVRGLTRAAYENFFPSDDDGVLEGSGGSSITQQLAKLLYFTYEERTERSIERKKNEIFLALAINSKFSKEEILEAYLNTVPLGNLTQGAEAASRVYFSKHADELTLGEAALLAGIPQSPTRYDPYRSWPEAKQRQGHVLDRMLADGLITESEAEAARQEDLDAKYNFTCEDCEPDVASLKESDAPHFVRYAQDELRELVGDEVYNAGGLKVTTSLDLEMQLTAQRITQQWSYAFETSIDPPPKNAAVSGIDPATGEILFYVGSRNYNDAPIEGENDILRSLQQPGSTMKVFTYLAAFWKGAPDNPETHGYDEALAHYKPETPVLDTQINPPLPGCINPIDPDYSPNNADRSFRGQITVRDALRFSRNIPAVRTISEIGWQPFIEVAHLLGIIGLNSETGYGCSITVGGADVRPLDLTFAGATLANNGLMRGRQAVEDSTLRLTGIATSGNSQIMPADNSRRVDPVSILRIEDANGNVIYDHSLPVEEQVVPPYYAWLVSDVLRLPTGTLGFEICGQHIAAKTGTQEKEDLEDEVEKRYSLDTWTMGWSRHLAATVWVGNSDNSPLSRDAFSTNTAGRLWRSIMETFLCDREPLDFDEPPAPEDYLDTPNRAAPPPDTLDPGECARLMRESGYTPADDTEPSLEELIGQLCSSRGGPAEECIPTDGVVVITPLGLEAVDPPCVDDGGGGGGNPGPFPNPFDPPGGGGGGGPAPPNPFTP